VSKDSDKDSKAAAPGKSKKGLILGIVGGVVVLVATAGAGIIFGPALLGGGAAEAAPGAGHAAPAAAGGEHAAPKEEKAEKGEKAAEKGEGHGTQEKIVSANFESMIVDIMDESGVAHHLKVGLSAELVDGVAVDDFKMLQPRGRDAAISYLRALSYEEVTNSKKFAKLKKELAKTVTKAMGEDKVHRLLVVDFVAQ